jgi:hypothetical protein
MQANIVIGGVIIWLFGGNLRDKGHAEMTLEKLSQIFGINYDTSSNNGIRIWKGMPCITSHILVIFFFFFERKIFTSSLINQKEITDCSLRIVSEIQSGISPNHCLFIPIRAANFAKK